MYRRSDYGPPPSRIRSSAEIRAALGEPPPQRTSLHLVPFTFWDGTVLPGGCSILIARPLAEMDAIFERYAYRLDDAGDDWCWNRRRVRGGRSWSMHSWATAVDINAATNPYSFRFQSDMPPAMVAEVEAVNYKGRPVWVWGGRFGRNGVGKTDAMHFQCQLTPAEARAYATQQPTETTEVDMSNTLRNVAGWSAVLDAYSYWRSDMPQNRHRPEPGKSTTDWRNAVADAVTRDQGKPATPALDNLIANLNEALQAERAKRDPNYKTTLGIEAA